MKTLIIPIRAIKRTETDSYKRGCLPETRKERILPTPLPSASILDMMSELVGENLAPPDIYTFDPNIYCDTQQPPGFRVVEDNEAEGFFRVLHDREENNRGRKPSLQEKTDFENGNITLKYATYELHFVIRIVGMDENSLAEFLGLHSGETHDFVTSKQT